MTNRDLATRLLLGAVGIALNGYGVVSALRDNWGVAVTAIVAGLLCEGFVYRSIRRGSAY